MVNYNSYHTCIKQLARTNKLPNKYAEHINRSTIWRWKQEKKDKYLGYELSNIDILQQFLDRRESDTAIRAYLKITLALSSLINKTSQIHKYLSQNKETLVRTIHLYKPYIKISFILRLLNLSPSVFYHWKNQVLYPCNTSPFQLCRRIYPNQLSEQETKTIKSLLNSPDFKYWPISSISHYARRNNLLHISLATWYNYVRKLGITRPALPKKVKYKVGIRADRPHRIWHADITIVKCLNGMKYYVYLLMDNYSRFILNYQVSEKVSAKIRLESIRNACHEYLDEYAGDTVLLVDGGPENNNEYVDRYIKSKKKSIRKLIAGRDIRFSNSMVEAQNKLIKYQYLFKHPFKDIKELRSLLDWTIYDYNHIRPHHSLGGLIPFEALHGKKLHFEELKIQLQDARNTRIAENKAASCGIC